MSIFYLLLIGKTQIADHTIEEKVYVFTQKQLSHMYFLQVAPKVLVSCGILHNQH